MARSIKGTIGSYSIQPGYVITEKNDGTLEGSVTFECDQTTINSVPGIDSAHPSDSRCQCYAREITYLTLGKARITNSYFGLTSRKTKATVSYTPNTNNDPITSHKDFVDFAGTVDDPNTTNGATFAETGEFLGFFIPAITDLFGAEYYLVPSTLVSLSYWTDSVPKLKNRMTIKTNIPGFVKPPDCLELMLLDTPYRQVGSHYQVTEQWMGSGNKGFSRIIYPQEEA